MVDVWLHAVPISLICSSEASVISFTKGRDLFHKSCEENNWRKKKQVAAGKLKIVIMM